MDDLYLDTIIDRYKHPLFQGWIDGGVVRKVHNASCGDMFEVSLKVQDGEVVDAKWRGEGCAISTVSVDTFCEWVIGQPEKGLESFSQERIRELTGISSITVAREKCLYLPLTLKS